MCPSHSPPLYCMLYPEVYRDLSHSLEVTGHPLWVGLDVSLFLKLPFVVYQVGSMKVKEVGQIFSHESKPCWMG